MKFCTVPDTTPQCYKSPCLPPSEIIGPTHPLSPKGNKKTALTKGYIFCFNQLKYYRYSDMTTNELKNKNIRQ